MVLYPLYKIEIGSLVIDSQSSDDKIDLAVRLTIDSAPGHFEAVIGLDDKKKSISKDDTVAVSLGYNKDGNKDLTTVFTSKAESVTTTGSKLMVLSPLTKLYELRLDKFYDHQSAGAIVKDLAKEAGIQVEMASDGLKFPSYTISKSKNAYEYIHELSQTCDFDFFGTNKGKLVFKKYDPKQKQPHQLQYGKNIIDIQLMDQNPPVESVVVSGSSPSDSKGGDTHYWLSKKNVDGNAGGSGGGGAGGKGKQLLIQNMAVKDKATAKKVAEATLKRIQSTFYVKALVIGNEKIMLGDTVKVQNAPDKSLNGEFQVREIEHFLSKSEGFTTSLICRGNKQAG